MKLRPLSIVAVLSLSSMVSLAWADPSARVGRISTTQGAVTLRNTISGDAQQALLNWPITSDNELITDADGRAEFRVGSAAVRLDGNTDLEIQQLDDNHFRLRLNRGSAEIRVRNPDLARDFSLDTQQGHILLSEPSSVRIDARSDTALTALTVQSGSVSFDGGNARFGLPAGRHAEVADGDLRVLESRGAYGTDSFDNWTAALDRQDARSQSARYLSAETTGYETLDSYGAWRVTSVYGPVWTPSAIPLDWAPYRDGRWTWISPWGWTWVDNAPWGYAPSHYGRWVYYDQRWCWTPGAIVAQPVWAPALVGWVGGRNWQVGFSGGPAAAVGWFPLAPRDVYVPGYQVSPRYVQQVNNTYIVNGNVQVQNNYYNGANQNYQNQYIQNAVTVVPQNQFSVSKTVLVTPTTLGSRQMAVLHAAPTAATAPPVSAPRGLPNLTAMAAPVMRAENSRAPALAQSLPQAVAATPAPNARPAERYQAPANNVYPARTARIEASQPAVLTSHSDAAGWRGVSPRMEAAPSHSTERPRFNPESERNSERVQHVEQRAMMAPMPSISAAPLQQPGPPPHRIAPMQSVQSVQVQQAPVQQIQAPQIQSPPQAHALPPAPQMHASPAPEPRHAAEPRQVRQNAGEREDAGRFGSHQTR